MAEDPISTVLQRAPGGASVERQGDDFVIQADMELSDDNILSSPITDTVESVRTQINSDEHDTLFDLLDALVDLDGELSGAVNAIAQSATYDEVVLSEDEPSSDEEDILEECKQLSEVIRGREVAVDVLRNLIKYGNDINKKIYAQGDGIQALQSLPINSVTIVEDRNDLGSGGSDDLSNVSDLNSLRDIFQVHDELADTNKEELDSDKIDEAFERDAYVLNEDVDEVTPTIIEPEDVLHFSIDARSHWFKDHTGRLTYGVWGQSRLEALKFTIQTKYNTLTNKVAMDDKLLAREVYHIDTEALFGDIQDREKRINEAESYADDLKGMLEELEADERPILPAEVSAEVIGPEGKAIDQRPFIEQLNNGIAAALTFPMAGLGRGTTAVKAGEEISSLWAENNLKNLRRAVVLGFEELFRDHIKLLHPELVENHEEAESLGEMRLTDDITIPTLKFEPFKQDDRTALSKQIETLVNVGVMGISEARDEWGLPTSEEAMERLQNENPNFGGRGQEPPPDNQPPGEEESETQPPEDEEPPDNEDETEEED